MIVSSNSLISRRLLRLRETGMGYQVLRAPTKSVGEALGADYILALNAEAITPVAAARYGTRVLLKAAPMRDSQRHDLARALETATLRVLDRGEAAAEGLIRFKAADGRSQPAEDSEIETSKVDERFLRYSAFERDRRINVDGSVVAGTYTTTYADGMTRVHTGMDAVRRYALPDPTPAVHRFYLRPPDPIAVRRGVVAPAYGQPGGGVEVLFEDGAPAGTRYDQDEMEPGE